MKIKVPLFERTLLRSYLSILSTISVIASIIFIFLTVPDECKVLSGIIIVALLFIIYFVLWVHANRMKRVELTINNSKVIVKIGDLFQEQGLKVVAFNEYFDTLVNEKVISSSSLNGQFIKKYVKDVNALDDAIRVSKHLSSPIRIREKNFTRDQGKTQKYKLGSIIEYEGHLITAFSKFSEDNRAFLTMVDYVNCLLNFWNEVDIVYANRSVIVPLLGTGITRLTDLDTMSEQEKLELLLWSFKVSRIKFTYPAKVTIVIHESVEDKINFYKLKEAI